MRNGARRIRVNGVLYEAVGNDDWNQQVTSRLKSFLVGSKFGSYKVTKVPKVRQYDKGQDIMFAASAVLTDTDSLDDEKLLITILCGRRETSIELTFLGLSDHSIKSRVVGWENGVWDAIDQLPKTLKRFIPKAERAREKGLSDRSDALRDFQTESIKINGVTYKAIR